MIKKCAWLQLKLSYPIVDISLHRQCLLDFHFLLPALVTMEVCDRRGNGYCTVSCVLLPALVVMEGCDRRGSGYCTVSCVLLPAIVVME